MSKKTIFTITFIILLIVLAGLVGYYLNKNDESTPNGTPSIFRNFFPFGGNDLPDNNDTTTPEDDGDVVEEPVDFIQKLRRISGEPVAGAGLLDVKAGTIVRYIEKATGHIFEVELFSPRQGRISNTTIPQVYDAVWGNKNESLMARYLKEDDQTIDTYSLSIKDTSTTTENTISGIAFPVNLSDVSVFGNSVFYLEKNSNSSYGYISTFSGSGKRLIWNSPLTELTSQYVNAKTVALTTKPEESTPGFLYFVDTSTGSIRNILQNILGLSALVNDNATEVLYLNQGGRSDLYLYNLSTRANLKLTPSTFPEKCVWSKKDRTVVYCAVPRESVETNSLTLWYKGQIQLTDDIWKFDLKNNSSSITLDLSKESGETIDVIKPILSDSEQYLVFVNKRNNSLWSLDLSK
ncbi:MAG: Uncharacterized protein CEO12_269 [Parcubacteria group bacterium Gr01-1014_46]|nr:MAG: Uncharacterized protein CEO12_269 [Parcubacteria group bacterium Gr01-1014_46]